MPGSVICCCSLPIALCSLLVRASSSHRVAAATQSGKVSCAHTCRASMSSERMAFAGVRSRLRFSTELWEGGAAQPMWHLPWRLKTSVANVLVTLWQSKKPWSSKSLMSPDVFESARSSRFTARFAREYDAIPILCDPSTCYRCCSQSMTASPDPRAMIRRTYPTLRRIPHTAYSTHGVRMYQCCLL